jgi:hypothetical protein
MHEGFVSLKGCSKIVQQIAVVVEFLAVCLANWNIYMFKMQRGNGENLYGYV